MPTNHPHIAFLTAWRVSGFLRGLARYANEAGWRLDTSMVVTGRIRPGRRIDGLIVCDAVAPQIREAIESWNVPTVALTHNTTEQRQLPRVLPDNHAIGRIAAEHLISRGFQRLGFLTPGGLATSSACGRHDGFRDAAEAHGRTFIRIDQAQWANTLTTLTKPVGVLAENDVLALELCIDCLAMGIHVPEEVAIIGVDNDELLIDSSPVPLTSVDSDTERAAYEAAALLDRILTGNQPQESITVPPVGIVPRASTSVMAVPHLPSAKALRRIWEQYRTALDLDEIARHAGMCRRRLDDAFKVHIGRSMFHEVRRLRIRDAKRMLTSTNQKVVVLAQALGFSSSHHFIYAFRQETGLTPRQYRDAHQRPKAVGLGKASRAAQEVEHHLQ